MHLSYECVGTHVDSFSLRMHDVAGWSAEQESTMLVTLDKRTGSGTVKSSCQEYENALKRGTILL